MFLPRTDDFVQIGDGLFGMVAAYFSVSHGHLDSGMTQKPRNRHNVDVAHYRVARKGMSKGMKRRALDVSLPKGLLK